MIVARRAFVVGVLLGFVGLSPAGCGSQSVQDTQKPPVSAPAVAPLNLVVTPNDDAKGDQLTLQSAIARTLSAGNIVPQDRIHHFAWISANKDLRIQGWRGRILDVSDTPQGKVVTIKIQPQVISSRGGSVTIVDYFTEIYAYRNQRAHFLRGIDPPDVSHSFVID